MRGEESCRSIYVAESQIEPRRGRWVLEMILGDWMNQISDVLYNSSAYLIFFLVPHRAI